jgi:hypothetical protein
MIGITFAGELLLSACRFYSAISFITWLRGTGDLVGMVKLHIFSVEFEADHW